MSPSLPDKPQFRLAFDKHKYLEIYRQNVAIKTQEYMVFKGIFAFEFTDALIVERHHAGPPEELRISRDGVVTVKGLTWLTKDWLRVLGKTGEFPESEATDLENCRNCKAKEHFCLVRQPGFNWNITEITMMKIGAGPQSASALPGLVQPLRFVHPPAGSHSAFGMIKSFFKLWDTYNPDKMQEATNQYTTEDVDIRIVLDNTQYILIYRRNVGLRMKEYLIDKGMLTFHADSSVNFEGFRIGRTAPRSLR